MPEIEVCPFCKHKTLSVFSTAGHNTPGYWLYCSQCEWGGDTLEVYSRIRKIKDLTEASRAAVGEGLSEVSTDSLTDWAVSSYIRDFPGRRERNRKIWEKMRENLMGELSPVMMQRIQRENLWGGWKSRAHKGLCQFIGGGTAGEINDIFNTMIPVLPKAEGYTSVLAIGYQDLPGRICAFHLQGPDQSKWHYVSDPRDYRSTVDDEGGLAMLESLSASEECVLAVGDVHLALQLHRLNFLDNDTPMKLVAFNSHTRAAWCAVNAQKVILWDNKVDWKLFDHARRVNNGHIYTGMSYGSGAYTYLRDHTFYEITIKMKREALPWTRVFARWILDREVNEYSKREAVTSLNLSARDQERIFAELTSDNQRNAMKRYLTEVRVVKSITINAKSITEKKSSWWLQLRAGEEECISDAPIRIDREVNDPVQGTTYLYGYVTFRNTKLPFCVNKTEIATKTIAWIEKHVATAGLGLPNINYKWEKFLLPIAKHFSEPAVGICYASYGIQPNTGDVVMPRFKITKKEIIKDDFYIASKAVPGLSVPHPQGRNARPTDRVFPARSAWIACAAMLAANWVRFYHGANAIPVLAIGSPGSIAHTAVTAFAKGMAMPTHTLGDAKRKTVEDLRAGLGTYNYPSLVQTRSARLLANYPAKNTDFIYFVADKLEGATMKAGGHWWTIEAPQLNLDPDILPPVDDLFTYLQDLQKRDFPVPMGCDGLDFIARDMCEWYGRAMGLNSEELYTSVSAYVKPTYSYTIALVDLIIAMKHHGHMHIEHSDIEAAIKKPKYNAVVIDDAANQVYMHRSRLNTALKGMDLPVIDMLHIANDANTLGYAQETAEPRDGLTLSLEFWHQRVAAWKSANL